jgi:integrase
MIWKPKYKVGEKDGKPIYKESSIYWMEFRYCGNLIRESTKQTLKTLAETVERKRRRELEENVAGINKSRNALTFGTAADEYLEEKGPHLSAGGLAIERNNLAHLLPHFGNKMLIAIEAKDFNLYQQARLREPTKHLNPATKKVQAAKKLASPASVNLELSTFRAILKRHGAWARIQPFIKALKVNDDVGVALTHEQEKALLEACSLSRSRSLLPFVITLLETGARFATVQNLRWCDVDFQGWHLTFGKDKTKAGSGRVVPLSPRAYETLKFWASTFPDRKSEHFVFPHQKYLGGGKKDHFGFIGGVSCEFDPTCPFGEIKEAWHRAKLKAARILIGEPNEKDAIEPLTCRFHDLRHTAVSRMLEAGVALAKVAKIVGWSPSTMVQMAARYGHFTLDELRGAVETISRSDASQIKQSYSQAVSWENTSAITKQ